MSGLQEIDNLVWFVWFKDLILHYTVISVTVIQCLGNFLLQVVDTSKNITEIPEWFRGSRLNYAENLLRYNDKKTAIIECGEPSVVNVIV